jgi:hypothetical protein
MLVRWRARKRACPVSLALGDRAPRKTQSVASFTVHQTSEGVIRCISNIKGRGAVPENSSRSKISGRPFTVYQTSRDVAQSRSIHCQNQRRVIGRPRPQLSRLWTRGPSLHFRPGALVFLPAPIFSCVKHNRSLYSQLVQLSIGFFPENLITSTIKQHRRKVSPKCWRIPCLLPNRLLRRPPCHWSHYLLSKRSYCET